jgi:PAS domain S-box-containing protein
MLYISPGYEEVWGRSCESLYARPQSWLDSIHPDDRERVRQAVMTQQTLGQYAEQFRIVRPDGSVRLIRDRAFPIRDASGAIYRIAGIAQDITELTRTADR